MEEGEIPPPPPKIEEVSVPPPPMIEKEILVEEGHEEIREEDVQQVHAQEEEKEVEPTQVSTSLPITIVFHTIPITRCSDTNKGSTSSRMGRGLVVSTMLTLGSDASLARMIPKWLIRVIDVGRGKNVQLVHEEMVMLTEEVTTIVVPMEIPQRMV